MMVPVRRTPIRNTSHWERGYPLTTYVADTIARLEDRCYFAVSRPSRAYAKLDEDLIKMISSLYEHS